MRRGNQLRIAQPDTHAGKLAGGKGPQRLRQLIAAVNQVIPGRKPHGNALANGVRHTQIEARHEAQHHQREANQGHENARARDAIERQKQAAKNQRRAHIFLQEEKQQRKRHARGGRQSVFDRRNIDVTSEPDKRSAGFVRVPQHVPAPRKIPGQKKHQQHADDLDRLETEQVDLGVARAGTGAEDDQQCGKREAGQQRHEAQAAGEAFEIEQRGSGHQHAAERRALGEIGEQQLIAQRIAQADHQHQADAGKQNQGGYKVWIATETARAPDHVDQQKGGEEKRDPNFERAAELLRPAHHQRGFEQAQLVAAHQRHGLAVFETVAQHL